MGTPGAIGGLFAHYPARPDTIRANADDLHASSTRIQDLGADVAEQHGLAVGAVAGALETPMSAAAEPVVLTADRVSAAATVASGALNLFASAVDAYNAGIDELNRRYEEAQAADFFAEPVDTGPVDQPTAARHQAHYDTRVAEARSAIEHLLRLLESRLHDGLDQAANTTAALLDDGPSPATLRHLTNAGVLPTGPTTTLVSDDEIPWAPGDLSHRCTESSPDSCWGADYDWDFHWDGFRENLHDTLDGLTDGAEWIWDHGGEEVWNFLAGDAIKACLDDPTSPDCGIEALALFPPLKALKLRKAGRVKEWFEKLLGKRRAPKSKPNYSANLNALPSTTRANVEDAIARAAKGNVRFPKHDSKRYWNTKGELPSGPVYREWTAAPAGARRGTDRVIIAGDPKNPAAIYYWDHHNPPVRIGP